MKNVTKKLLILLCGAMIATPVFATKDQPTCKEKCKDAALTCYVLPLMIPVARKDGKCLNIGELINNELGIVIAAGVGHLAIIGGVTGGIVAAVKYYKKKKQAAQEQEQLAEENVLIENQQQETTQAEEIV